MPSKTPAMTSVVKCTYKYNLEKEISIAKTNAGTLIFFAEVIKSVTAAAKDEQVCPDGKEYPEGGGIISKKSVLV